MSEKTTNKSYASDLAQVDALSDDDIDTSEIAPTSKAFFQNARLRMPDAPIQVTVEVDQETWAWYQGLGEEATTRMRAALRIYAQSHRFADA